MILRRVSVMITKQPLSISLHKQLPGQRAQKDLFLYKSFEAENSAKIFVEELPCWPKTQVHMQKTARGQVIFDCSDIGTDVPELKNCMY